MHIDFFLPTLGGCSTLTDLGLKYTSNVLQELSTGL